MLSIKYIESSKAATSYFQKDDYYAGKDGSAEAGGAWYGQGAERLGLTGVVEPGQFQELLDGKLPSGEQLGTIREKGGEKEHKHGWDMTFSAPKSASILGLVGDDERLLRAHDESVREAIDWMEGNLAGYRKRGWLSSVDHHNSGNVTAALFQHATSRDKDPQLHTHVVVMNMTHDEDGKWRSLNSKKLYDFKMAMGNIYRAAYAERIQELGYSIERIAPDGRFEISAVPEEVRSDMSRRSNTIREAMAERGLEGDKSAERVALMTRPTKQVSPIGELQLEWRERNAKLGFDSEQAVATALHAGDRRPLGPYKADQAVQNAIDRLKDKEAVFEHSKLLQWSLAAAMGRGGIREVEAAVAKAKTDRNIEQTVLHDARAWTTPEARAVERKVVDTWRDSRGAVTPAMTEKAARAALEAADREAQTSGGKKLNDGQNGGAMAILRQSDRFVGIEGRAGVGKTTMLGRVRPLLEAQGYTVLGMASNANAARNLQEEAKIPSTTLDQRLRLANKALIEITRNTAQAGTVLREHEKQVWVIDEASQVGAKKMARLMYLADRLGARVVMIGDTRQLAAIEAGKPFGLLFKEGMHRTVIDENLRQRKAEHKKAVALASEGKVKEALATLAGSTYEIDTREARLSRIVADWAKLGDARDKTSVLTARNAERIELNERMRDVLRREGQLQGEIPMVALSKVFQERVDKADALTYKAGDIVQFGRGAKALGIAAGGTFSVVAIDKQHNKLTLEQLDGEDKGRKVSWNPRQIAGTANNGVVAYRERVTSLAPGETIQWGKNERTLQLSDGSSLINGRTLSVAAIGEGSLTLRSETGATIRFDPREFRGQHWDHARAKTIYKSQGQTDEHTLVNGEAHQTELFNQKALVVSLSRHRESITLYVDNREGFENNVKKHLGEKTSVQESKDESRFQAMRASLDSMYASYTGPRSRIVAGGGGGARAPDLLPAGSPASQETPTKTPASKDELTRDSLNDLSR